MNITGLQLSFLRIIGFFLILNLVQVPVFSQIDKDLKKAEKNHDIETLTSIYSKATKKDIKWLQKRTCSNIRCLCPGFDTRCSRGQSSGAWHYLR